MTRAAFRRARRPEHKQQRREAILTAARELARTSGVRNVSLGAVAEAVGLAKSNIVRYFGTREEIYLVLLAEEWRSWADAVRAALRQSSEPGSPHRIATLLADTLIERPLFCDLLSHSSTTLEHNVSVEAARAYKVTALSLVAELGEHVAAAAGLSPREGAELVGAACALAGMLYQASNPPPALAQVYAEDPALDAACPKMEPSLARALTALAAGLPALREQQPG
ncbi:TetR family transcriptional regulator [Nonomuraea fastidiosa]|jgi:AcrR family transcriptional regulator|uniref:TetR/AcrR family transcriptional regulator n=1 Tax=Nonomuraea TaxID=83681 RepID=UPI0034330741